jgi:hypothetical protein
MENCNFCPNEIHSNGFYVSCLTCKSRSCIPCGQDLIKSYGNKYYIVSSLYCNYCFVCDPWDCVDSDSESEEENEEIPEKIEWYSK